MAIFVGECGCDLRVQFARAPCEVLGECFRGGKRHRFCAEKPCEEGLHCVNGHRGHLRRCLQFAAAIQPKFNEIGKDKII